MDARLGVSIRSSARQLKSILMRRANSEYVCMYVWGSWACMSVCLSQTYKICLFRRVSNSSRKTFSIWSPIQFFEICEGRYFQEPSEAPNMYVCMFELQTWPKHVCMYVWQAQASMYVCLRPSEHVCMYVSGSWACMYVCLRQLSMYVCMSQKTYIHTCLNQII